MPDAPIPDAADAAAQDDAVAAVRALFDRTRAALTSADARDEALGEYVEPKPVLGIRRDPTMRSHGRVWRLGALLLGREDGVWATGSITRVREPGRPQYQSNSAEIRRAYRAAATKGHFRTGETVNHGAVAIPVDETLLGASGPLFVRDGRAFVRWSPTAGDDAAIPLEGYLADRVELLVHPPQGA